MDGGESFRRRHPELKQRTGEKLAYSRMVSSTSKILDNYFDILESTFVENDLCDKPFQIYNVDESNIPLDPPAVKVISLSGVKHSQTVSTGNKTERHSILSWQRERYPVQSMD